MPIFVYRCSDCGKVFEKLERMDSEPSIIHLCSETEHLDDIGRIERIPTTASFKFVGNGFYATDYPKGRST
jgi:putative FmdB family regulatory protein